MDLNILQHYWWILICILGGLLVFLLFVQGGQSLLYTIGKNKDERDLIVNTLGHKWEYTFTTLVVFGGAFFASFPLFYSTSFGGAYVVWMLILFCFVLQAVSYEYRNKKNNFLGSRTYEVFLMINGFAAPLLLGAAVATFFTGSPFRLGVMHDVEWMTPWRGLDALFVITNYFLALAVFFLAQTAASAAAARTALAEGGFSLVLSDMRLPDEDGIALLQWMSGQRIEVPVIVMTSYAEIQNAVRCMKLGARDYVAKPVNPDELLKKIREALDAPAPVGDVPPVTPEKAPETSRAAGGDIPNYIEGQSDAARQLYEYVRLVAPTNMSVLVNGASGTGKEHVAQLIHRQSKRAGKPFVAVDCGAIPRDLAASEFFGHVKGSFTGAVGDKTGAFEAASGGTLFLDEVGNLTYETQVQLLRALQERRIRPVGSNREVAVDIRLVAATNEDLEAAIARGTFRADLYHRINEFTLRMPEVRQMREDIMLYADFFLDQANRQLDKHIVGFDGEAAAAMVRYDWPGNLRQMKNTVMSATLLCRGDYISCRELPAEIAGVSGAVAVPLRNPAGEEEQIRRALALAGGNKSQAAKLLGIDRKTLYNKLHLYGIE